MNKIKVKNQLKSNRVKRIRAKIIGTAKNPRLNVFRSLKHIYAQIIDDQRARTLVAANDLEIKNKKIKKTDKAKEVGKLIAQKAAEQKITKVVFDRGGNKYHGRIKAVAEGAREGGLKF
jgi:large subunit ribosomal protein L18